MPERLAVHDDLATMRQRIVQALLVSMSVLGGVAYVPSVWLAWRVGLISVVVVDTLVYAVVLIAAFWPGASDRIRSYVVVGSTYLLGVFLIPAVGSMGAGLMWLHAAPVIAAVSTGFRSARRMLIVNALTIAVLAAATWMGLFAYVPAPATPVQSVASFVVTGTNGFLISAALAWAVGSLLSGLDASHASLRAEAEQRLLGMAERQRLEAHLREAHKLEAVGRLASGIAHDFNNLLVPILGHADDLRRREPAGSRNAAALDDILASAERGRSLVQQILTVGRRAAPVRTAVDLGAVLREVIQLLRAGLPQNIAMVPLSPERPVFVIADALELHQILMNLGTNAAYAMRASGGVLTIRISEEPAAAMATVVVGDTGCGMPEDVRERAFEPFFSTKPPGEGTGLGLATVYSIVTTLGGRVAIESEAGKGTAVSITLPTVSAAPAAVAAEPDIPGPSAAPAPMRMLLVDDEPMVLKLCAAILKRAGHDVEAFEDAQEALRHLAAQPGAFHLLLTDRTMPTMDGLTLAGRARTLAPDLAIVLTTGYLDEDARAEAERVGIAQVVSKPFRADVLLAAIDAAAATVRRA